MSFKIEPKSTHDNSSQQYYAAAAASATTYKRLSQSGDDDRPAAWAAASAGCSNTSGVHSTTNYCPSLSTGTKPSGAAGKFQYNICPPCLTMQYTYLLIHYWTSNFATLLVVALIRNKLLGKWKWYLNIMSIQFNEPE